MTHPFPPNLQNIITVKPKELGSWNFERRFTRHHMSHVRCNISHVRCHVLHTTCHILNFFNCKFLFCFGHLVSFHNTNICKTLKSSSPPHHRKVPLYISKFYILNRILQLPKNAFFPFFSNVITNCLKKYGFFCFAIQQSDKW